MIGACDPGRIGRMTRPHRDIRRIARGKRRDRVHAAGARPYDRAVADRIRVFVVDDHGMVRRGVRSYLSIFDDIEVVGEAAGGREALERLRAMAAAGAAPDVVLMDLAMEPVDGVTATRELRAAHPEVEVVAVTSLIDQSLVQSALEAGASGYLVKDAAPEELALAIRAAHAGEVHLDGAVARRLMDSLGASAPRTPDTFGELSPRELEILRLIAAGQANKEIARRLVISERTARTHVSHVLRKLGLSSRTQAAVLAVREGLAPQP
jgi:DNA-binding NarL/FixJ family response regulator